MKTFDSLGYEIVRNIISKETANLLDKQYEMLKNRVYYYENIDPSDTEKYNDDQITHAFTTYGALFFEPLLEIVLPKMEEITGKNLYPCYSYSRIYYNSAEMKRHIDRKSCEYSATLTISIDEKPWEIWFKDINNQETPLLLDVGDLCIYKGTILEHWRTPYEGNRQVQVFLHFVDQNGPYKEYKFDTRPILGLDLKDRDKERYK